MATELDVKEPKKEWLRPSPPARIKTLAEGKATPPKAQNPSAVLPPGRIYQESPGQGQFPGNQKGSTSTLTGVDLPGASQPAAMPTSPPAAPPSAPQSPAPYSGPWPLPERGPVTPIDPADTAKMTKGGPGSKLRDRFTPIERANPGAAIPAGTPTGGVITPYNDTLNADISRKTDGKGFQAIPKDMAPNAGGGNVSQFMMSKEQQAEVAARRADAIPSMDSYDRALDQKNLNEGIHGADMARQIKMFQDKYGVDLRGKEFQLKKQELEMNAPKVAAETKQALAHADYFESGGSAGSKNKDPRISQLNDMAKQIAHQLTTDTLMDDTKREELQQQWQNIYDMMGQMESSGKDSASPKTTPDRAKISAIIKQKAEQNIHWGDIEKDLKAKGITDIKEYEAEYLKHNKKP
jgi:hypothetical protein